MTGDPLDDASDRLLRAIEEFERVAETATPDEAATSFDEPTLQVFSDSSSGVAASARFSLTRRQRVPAHELTCARGLGPRAPLRQSVASTDWIAGSTRAIPSQQPRFDTNIDPNSWTVRTTHDAVHLALLGREIV